MADTDVGMRGTIHTEHGPNPCWILAYEAGRDSGDHYIAYFNPLGNEQGDVTRRWAQVGDGHGQFTVG